MSKHSPGPCPVSDTVLCTLPITPLSLVLMLFFMWTGKFYPRLQASWSPCPESGLWAGTAQRPHASPAVAPGSDERGCWVHSELLSLEMLRHLLAAVLVGFLLLSSGSQNVFPGSATSVSPGNFLEMQILRPFSRSRISSGAQQCVS